MLEYFTEYWVFVLYGYFFQQIVWINAPVKFFFFLLVRGLKNSESVVECVYISLHFQFQDVYCAKFYNLRIPLDQCF